MSHLPSDERGTEVFPSILFRLFDRTNLKTMKSASFPSVSISQVESNLPGEDRYSLRVANDVAAFAVYDGHGGYLACDMACGTLLDMIVADLSVPPSEELTNIRYLILDNEL